MVIVTDPVYVRNVSEYQINIEDKLHDAQSRLFVKLPISDSLFSQIGSLKSHLKASSEFSEESFYKFGSGNDSIKAYDYIGWHGSDSGMTCIVEDDPFSNENVSEVDSTEFTLSSLQDPESESNCEEFPLYKWYGRIPQAASSIRVYACDLDTEGNYNGLIIRAGEDDLVDNETNDQNC